MEGQQVLPRRVEITKGDNGFGFNLSKAEGRHYLRVVDEGGAAWVGGARSGDRILAVNDVSVTQRTHKELVAFIKSSGVPMSMILLATDQQMVVPEEAVPLQIYKGAQGYGFNLAKRGNMHYFKKVDELGPAHNGGARAGDIIYEVNGISVTGLSHGDHVKLVKAGGDMVSFKVVKELWQQTRDTAASTEQRLSAGDSAQQAASTTIAQARMRAEQAMIERRAEEERLQAARKKEMTLQKLSSELNELRDGIEAVTQQLEETTEKITIERIKVAKVATSEELKELEDTLLLVEAEAINELNAKQDKLPLPSRDADEIELATVQLAEMGWEFEVAACREHLASSRLADTKKLHGIAEVRRKEEKQTDTVLAADMQKRRANDMNAIEERRKRMDAQLEEIRLKKEQAAAEQKRNQEAAALRRKKEAEERAAQAIAVRRKMEAESEAKSGAEEKRRAQELEDQRFQEEDARRRKEEMQARLREQQERDEAEEAARLKNPASMFGGQVKRREPKTLTKDRHPMISIFASSAGGKTGLTSLCKPPDTYM
eukprot:m.276873 g.276873  ORF g.276873 m.276873 type:complete len:544 (+) comp19773_c0_seq1:430-2061(+)